MLQKVSLLQEQQNRNRAAIFKKTEFQNIEIKKLTETMYNTIKLQKIALKFRTVAIHYVCVLLVTSTITLK